MFKKNFYLTIFTVYQFFSTLLLAIGVLPPDFIYLNLLLELIAVIFFDPEYALLSIILSTPFYLALPLHQRDSLESWRIVSAVFFVVFLLKSKIIYWREKPRFDRSLLKFYRWDKYLAWLAAALLISIVFSSAPMLGIKKLAFAVNIYILYLAGYNIWQNQLQRRRAIIAAFIATAIIVLLGYIQLTASFTTSIYYFWQYWAVFVTKTYYGSALYSTVIYSNSWFTFPPHGGDPSLRMFSILPDSHSFAVIALFSITFGLAVLKYARAKYQKVLIWVYIVLANLAIIFSGTKGVWVGVGAIFLLCAGLFIRRFGRKIIRPIFATSMIFLILFALSPLIQKAVGAIRSGRGTESFIARAKSIYDLNESSNAGRIFIWKTIAKYSAGHFITGAGYGNFAEIVRPQAETIKKLFNLPVQDITAHNLYLGFLAEAGILGFLAALLYFKSILSIFAKFFKKYYLFFDDPEVLFVVSSGVTIFALLVYSLVDETLYNDRVLIFFFLVLALAASIMVKRTDD